MVSALNVLKSTDRISRKGLLYVYIRRGLSMICRPGCAACCIYISISSPLPGMPDGKKTGVRCCNLDDNNFCTIHGTPLYPPVCKNFKADIEMCGLDTEHAIQYLCMLEDCTKS